MKMLVTAIAIAVATPAAAQTASPAHSGHGASPVNPSGKSCCCDKQGTNKKKMECCEKANGDKPAAEHSEHNH